MLVVAPITSAAPGRSSGTSPGPSPNASPGTSVTAAPPTTPVQRAEAATREAQALEKAGKKDEALAKYEEAYAITPTGPAAYQMARMEAGVGRFLLSLQHYREALRDTKLPTDARREAETAVEDLKTKIGIIILDVPESAVTTVDGKEVDPKQPAEVTPGPHVVKIRLGGETRSADVSAKAGAVSEVRLRFGADPSPEKPATGLPVAGGPSPSPKEETRWPTPKLVAVGAGAAVAVGLVAASAIVFAMADDAKAPTPGGCVATPDSAPCRELADRRDSYDSSRTVSTVFFYSGLVVGALTAGAALLWPNQKSTVTNSLRAGRTLMVTF